MLKINDKNNIGIKFVLEFSVKFQYIQTSKKQKI